METTKSHSAGSSQLFTQSPSPKNSGNGVPFTMAGAEEHQQHRDPRQGYLRGWKLASVGFAIFTGLFLGNLEIPIVNSALFNITEDLGDYDNASWLISAYLLGFTSMVVILAKLSDIYGRRTLLLAAYTIFIIFSAACGGAQSLNQLIIFRAFKGIGGAGLGTLPIITIYDLVPAKDWPAWSTYGGIAFAIANIIGPVVGGVISTQSTWRWVFLLNIPIAVPFAAVIAFLVPRGMPYDGDPQSHHRSSLRYLTTKSTLKRIDIAGSTMLLVGTALFVAAFQEAGKSFPWRSAFVIVLITISGLLLIAFLAFEKFITSRGTMEPVIPWRILTNRVYIGLTLFGICCGMTWIVPVYQIPQRYQVINGTSALGGGTRLMAFTAFLPVGAIVASVLAKKGIPPIYIMLGASVFQIVGAVFLGTLSYSTTILARQYGFQIILGLGCGPVLTLLPLMIPWIVEPRDRSVAATGLIQFRYMGAVMGLSIATTAMNNLVRSQLSDSLKSEMIEGILRTPALLQQLSSTDQDTVLRTFQDGFNLQMKIVAGIAGGSVLSCLLMWQKNQIKVDGSQEEKKEEVQLGEIEGS